MCHLYFHTGDSINDTEPAVFPKPIKPAWLGRFVSPALVQQSRRKGGQHRKASVGITTRKGKFVASVGGAKMLCGRALHKGDGKVCNRTALLIWPQGNVQRDGMSEAGCSQPLDAQGGHTSPCLRPSAFKDICKDLTLCIPCMPWSLTNSTKSGGLQKGQWEMPWCSLYGCVY